MKKIVLAPHECPVLDALEVFAGKWKVCILFELKEGPVRFNDLRRRISKINQKMLTQQLQQLERDGLVLRTHYPEIPPRVEYSLTKLAKSIDPVLLSMVTWAKENMKQVEKARRLAKAKKSH